MGRSLRVTRHAVVHVGQSAEDACPSAALARASAVSWAAIRWPTSWARRSIWAKVSPLMDGMGGLSERRNWSRTFVAMASSPSWGGLAKGMGNLGGSGDGLPAATRPQL